MATQNRIESQIIWQALGFYPEPPVDLVDIAARIGVGDVRATKFRDGFTDFRREKPIIFLNRIDSGSRMRFVFAHEIAHVMLRMPSIRCLLETSRQTELLSDEENFADRIGATLLVPDSWVHALYKVTHTLEGLQHLADRADVPLMMLIDRMASAGLNIGLLHWWKGRSSWHVVDRPGVPTFLRGSFELSEPSKRKFEDLREKESIEDIDGHVDGRRVEITGPVYRRGLEVFQLISSLTRIRLTPRRSPVHAAHEGRRHPPVGDLFSGGSEHGVHCAREIHHKPAHSLGQQWAS